MPETSRDCSVSFKSSRRSQLRCSSSLARESKPTKPATVEDVKEWEDVRCPVCMEHPHNAVLLICSSFHKGCRPYMCDTSYRHSNCLDQFRKSFAETSAESPADGNNPPSEDSEVIPVEAIVTGPQDDRKSHGSIALELLSSMHKLQQKLVCPLCRGQICGWVVVDLAREFMNSKSRSCACEACEFTGAYADLRKHARSEHPQVRPAEADPKRLTSWRNLERQRDLGDLYSSISTIRSSFGDVQDERQRDLGDLYSSISTIRSSFGDVQEDGDSVLSPDDRGWVTIFLLYRIWRPSTSPSSGSWSGTSRARTRAQTGARRRSARLWGESYEPEAGSNSVEDDETSDGGSMTWRRRVRRRLSTPDDDI